MFCAVNESFVCTFSFPSSSSAIYSHIFRSHFKWHLHFKQCTYKLFCAVKCVIYHILVTKGFSAKWMASAAVAALALVLEWEMCSVLLVSLWTALQTKNSIWRCYYSLLHQIHSFKWAEPSSYSAMLCVCVARAIVIGKHEYAVIEFTCGSNRSIATWITYI